MTGFKDSELCLELLCLLNNLLLMSFGPVWCLDCKRMSDLLECFLAIDKRGEHGALAAASVANRKNQVALRRVYAVQRGEGSLQSLDQTLDRLRQLHYHLLVEKICSFHPSCILVYRIL